MADKIIMEMKLGLKLMVDTKAKKVVFAEADKAFADFIYNLINMPLTTVAKVLLDNKKDVPGCLGPLYKSIDSLGDEYFELTKSESVLKPKASVVIPLLALYDSPPSTTRIFKCGYNRHISDVPNTVCPCYTHQVMTVLDCTYSAPKKTSQSPGYARETVVYMVMDNLEVKPMSMSLVKSHVKDLDFLEEKQIEVGLHEGLAILKASMETANVLTTIFLKKN